jgi:hypothetical protein
MTAARELKMPNLSVEDVTELITRVRSARASDAVGVVREILAGLGASASVTGEVLQQAVRQSAFPLPAEAVDALKAVQSISRDGDRVTIDFGARVERTVRGDTPVRLGPAITFAVENFSDGMALANIAGVTVKKFVWIEIQRVHFREAGGRRSVRVDTNFGGKEFTLP